MKFSKQIALTVVLLAGIFGAILYSSCQKDTCKGVTCVNTGTCMGGYCSCKTGIGGANCETIYRNVYAYTYKGDVTINGNYDSLHSVVDSALANHQLVFVAGTDTANYNNMQLSWEDSSGKVLLNMPIVLSNNSASGSDFTVPPVTNDTFTFTGTGNVNAVTASMVLTRSHPHGGAAKLILQFNSFSKQ